MRSQTAFIKQDFLQTILCHIVTVKCVKENASLIMKFTYWCSFKDTTFLKYKKRCFGNLFCAFQTLQESSKTKKIKTAWPHRFQNGIK